MLDDTNVLAQRDPHGALGVAADLWQQVQFQAAIEDGDHDGRQLDNVVFVGMGGSGLAALLARDWLSSVFTVPFEVVRGYHLPNYVSDRTLVIVCSYSGNTEETLSCLQQARDRMAQIGIIASGGKLLEVAGHQSIAHTILPQGVPQRMAMLYMLRALLALLVNFRIVQRSVFDDVARTADFLRVTTEQLAPGVSTDKNYAKQLALLAVGKTPVFYGGELTASVAYKWKISWNETAKNVAFWNQYSEFNHNEFMGWTAQPVEKPFAVFDLVSSHEHPQILRRFEISDRLLSGQRPKATTVQFQGETVLEQLLWGCVLADFASTYAAILNNVDPVPVELIERLKKELA